MAACFAAIFALARLGLRFAYYLGMAHFRGPILGQGPRGTIAFFRVAQALAVLDGRGYAVPDDVQELRHSVLRHRLHLTFEALADRVPPETVIDAVFAAVPTP